MQQKSWPYGWWMVMTRNWGMQTGGRTTSGVPPAGYFRMTLGSVTGPLSDLRHYGLLPGNKKHIPAIDYRLEMGDGGECSEGGIQKDPGGSGDHQAKGKK